MFNAVQQRLAFFIVFLFLSYSCLAQTSGPDKGVLYLHGGNGVNVPEFAQLVVDETGKKLPSILFITTAQGAKRGKKEWPKLVRINQFFNAPVARELFIQKKEDANADEVVALIDTADAIFIEGGRVILLTTVYSDTKALEAMRRLLERGGVIGGSSAGALAMSYDVLTKPMGSDLRHQLGFDFLKHSILSVHVTQRNKQNVLLHLLSSNTKQLKRWNINSNEILGIGLDEKTAIIVRQNQFTVTGKGNVYIYDPRAWASAQIPFYETLIDGQQYDMTLGERIR